MSEPRTAQFLIERKCPHGCMPGITSDVRRQAEDTWPPLPVSCWVFAEPTKNSEQCGDGGKVYVIDTSQPAIDADGQIYWLEGVHSAYIPAVCEHMGHLIE